MYKDEMNTLSAK